MKEISCCIPSCPRPKNLSCYSIPKDVERKKKWLTNIFGDNGHIPNVKTFDGKNVSICSLHFKPNDFVYLVDDNPTSKREIHPDAVPSVFPWSSDWQSNFEIEMEMASKLSNPPTSSSDQLTTQSLDETTVCLGLPEGEAVQIGSVESLGIHKTDGSIIPATLPVNVISNNDQKVKQEEISKATPNKSSNSLQRPSKETVKNPPKKKLESSETKKKLGYPEDMVNVNPGIFQLLSKFQYGCGECDFKTVDPFLLRRHRSESHSGQPSQSKTPSTPVIDNGRRAIKEELPTPPGHPVDTNPSMRRGTKIFSCEICEFTTDRACSIKIHNRQHSGPKKLYECPKCSYSVSNAPGLKRHLQYHHTGDGGLTMASPRAVKSTASGSEFEVEHLCSLCPFTTYSRDEFIEHEKTHLPAVGDSSTEALTSTDSDSKKKPVKKEKFPVGNNLEKKTERVERLVYCCPKCNFWIRYHRSFHHHLVLHDETPAFSCSACNFTARYRNHITKHIRSCIDDAHKSASWELLTRLPEKSHYDKYLKKIFVPAHQWTGKIGHATAPNLSLELENSLSSNDSVPSSDSSRAPSSLKSEDKNPEWVPSDSVSDIDEDYSSSSISVKTTTPSITDDTSLSISSFSTDSKSDSDPKPRARKSWSEGSSNRRRRRSSAKATPTVKKKMRRIISDESSNSSNSNDAPPVLAPTESGQTETQPSSVVACRRTSPNSIYQEEIESGQPFFQMKPVFPLIDAELSNRQKIRQQLNELQKTVDATQVKLRAMEEADSVSQFNHNQLMQRRDSIRGRLAKLNNQKIEAELQVRLHQCKELKLNLALYESSDQSEDQLRQLTCDLNETKKLISLSESNLKSVCEEMTVLNREYETVCQQVKETEDSRTSVAQLIQITQSEISEVQSEIQSCNDKLIDSNSRMHELVHNEKESIKLRASCCETELHLAYMQAVAKIKDTEKNWLDTLDEYVKKNENPAGSPIV